MSDKEFIETVKKALIIGIIVVTALLLLDIFTHKANAAESSVIGTFKYGKYQRNVVSISDWQYKINKSLGIPFETQLYLRTIQTQECGDENGFCMNRIDCGPFQVNQIHKTENAWCKTKVSEGKKAIEKAKKNNNWKDVIRIRNELYTRQVSWTWNRMKGQIDRFQIPKDREERIRQLGVYHNGSKTKRDYGRKCVISYKILREYHINHSFK